MSKLIEFTKIESAGNDFIFIDGGKYPETIFSETVIKNMCDRHFGIGADGLILINKRKDSAFRMRYYNSDGIEAKMCANGARGAVLFAAVSGIIDCEEEIMFIAADGQHKAIIHSANDIEVEILFSDKGDIINLTALALPEKMDIEGFTDTGVPHLVVNCQDDLDKIDINTLGRRLRFDPIFGKEGTNVNFIKASSADEIFIRSYERGIEGETLSCGTGVAAAALLLLRKGGKKSPMLSVNSKGGKLIVRFSDGKLFLRGPVNLVYVGNLHLD